MSTPTYPQQSPFPPYYGAPYGYPPAGAYPASPPPPAPEPPKYGSRFVPIFGTLLIVLTLGAVLLAFFGSSLVNALQAPSGWHQVYSGAPSSASGNWDTKNGCTLSHGGLYASQGATCAFVPNQSADVTSQGFFLKVTVAPAGDVPSLEQTAIGLGASTWMCVDQLGTYILSDLACSATLTSANPPQTGEVSSLHTDALVANTLSVLYDAKASTVTYAANGQPFATVNVRAGSSPITISLGTGQSGETIITNVTLTSPTGGQ